MGKDEYANYDNDRKNDNRRMKTYGLSLAYRRLTVLPHHIATDSLTSSITSLDLTDCKIKYLESLSNFTSLNVLILDHNGIEDISNCPTIRTLETLWCNNNEISKLASFLNNCADKFPTLKHLSIMRNPSVPDIHNHQKSLLLEEFHQDETIETDNNKPDGDLLNDRAHSKSKYEPNKKIDYKLDDDVKGDIYTEDYIIHADANNDNTNSNNRSKEDHLLYRPAVFSVVKHLESLDGIFFTADEITLSSSAKVASWIATDDLDETENWKWPVGYTPPLELLRDKNKMKMIRHIQSILELRPICRDTAKLTYWNLDKLTIVRYLDASLWKEDLNGIPVYQAILDSITWRQNYGVPFKQNDKVWLKEGLGNGFIFIPCAYDSIIYSKTEADINEDNNNDNDEVDDDDGIGLNLDCYEIIDEIKGQINPIIDPNSRYRTRDGKPVLYIRFEKDRCTDGHIKGRTLIYSFERAIQLLPCNQTSFLVIIDMNGFGYNSAPAMKDLKAIGESLSKHMCCRLFKVYIVNVSFLTKMVYDTISSLFSEVTRSKFVFISDKKEILSNLKDLIDVDNIPVEYGGNSNDMLNFDFKKYMEYDPFINPTDERFRFCYS